MTGRVAGDGIRCNTGDDFGHAFVRLPFACSDVRRCAILCHREEDFCFFRGLGESLNQLLETSSVGLNEVVRVLSALAGRGAQSFSAQSVAGFDRVFAVVPLASGNLFLLGNWAMAGTDTTIFQTAVPIVAFPALMWLASLLVAQLAAEHQVLRHIRALRASITAFAGGNRRVPELDLEGAPHELRSVGFAFERMMESVLHDEAELEDMVHQKEVLLREVHHRVKNNLQVITSLLRLEVARKPESGTVGVLREMQGRIRSMALLHETLYRSADFARVDMTEYLRQLATQLHRAQNTRPGAIRGR